ncbi:MAG: S-layer protein [Methanoregula sp.]
MNEMSRTLPSSTRDTAGTGESCYGHRTNLPRLLCLVSIVLVLLAISPALAGTQIMAGSPALGAHIAGTNEFSPGDDVNLQVVIENTGLNQFMIVQSGIISPTDLSNTAKQLTATLSPGDAPLVVKADPQIVGDLPASASATATFHVTVNQYAAAGTYQLPVVLNYTYLYQANQEGSETLNYQYKSINQTISIPITITPEVQIAVPDVEPENLNAGIEGYVNMTVENVGSDDGRNAVIRVQQNGQSPITPTEGSVYIGDFPVGAVVNCTFRVMVASTAQQKTYPLDVLVYYKNYEGDYVNSPIETVGVPVGQKVDFSVTPASASISPGANAVITVQYQNTGGTTAYNAEARISAVDPFTSNDDTAFLGTMAPGDTRTASFAVSVDPAATVKEYGLDSEVLYRDALDNQFTSDPLKVNVDVVPAQSVVTQIGLPGLIAIILAVLAIAGYVIYIKRFKPR